MSWKSIEMQVALPRTQDAGKLQEQMTKQGQHLQESLAANQLKQDNNARKRVANSEETSKVNTSKDQNQPTGELQDQRQNQSGKTRLPTNQHPYLGKNIDFKG